MARTLKVSIGQHSDQGRKESNQDFHGTCVPAEPELSQKGVALVLADGISSSRVSHEASRTAVRVFLEDYYRTSPAWSVKTSAQRVLSSVNSSLHSQTRQGPDPHDKDRGYVCTFAALVLKSATAHLFHAGDSRIWRARGGAVEPLTEDHRVRVSDEQSYLGRALGIDSHLEVDYQSHRLEPGDVFILTTDGVHEFAGARVLQNVLADHADDLDAAARRIVAEAFERGSGDNLSVVIARVDEVPERGANEALRQSSELPQPPALAPRMTLDGWRLVRELHASARSHVWLATGAADEPVAIKVLATETAADPAHLERFLMEDWVAQRIASPHVLAAAGRGQRRSSLYTVWEYVDGQTLQQWMLDHPRPPIEAVRRIVEQIASGLTAFHRLEMLHQDLRPANVLIDARSTVKILDFGSARVAGVAESVMPAALEFPGTVQYMAPEYFLGEGGSEASDQFSLGVIVYQMLSGRLPYGADVARARTRAAQRRLTYASVLADDREIPAWMDEVLRKATHIDPLRRYQELSELVHDLRHPPAEFLRRTRKPLIERNPVAFWRGVALLLVAGLVVVLFLR